MFRITPRALWLPALLSGLGMFALSYLWHGTVLNDLKDIGDDVDLYFLFSIAGYLLLGLLFAHLQIGLFLSEWIEAKENPIPKMMLTGLATGIMIGCLLLALTLPLKGRVETEHAWLDLGWQIVEQTAGAILAAVGMFIHRVRANLEREGAL